jgi:hypothetical protein
VRWRRANRTFTDEREEIEMADSTSKRGAGDRDRVAGGQEYEVDYIAKKHGVSPAQVKEIIKRVGNSREKIEAELRKGT